jgi:small subunit ribosomal protein S20
MPNIASAKKRAKQNIAKNIHNASLRSEYRTMIKKVLNLITQGKKDEASNEFRLAQKRMDIISSKGIIHSRTCSRNKKRLVAKIKSLN